MRPLTPADGGFLSTERREMPMHVGSLMLFESPGGASRDLLREIYEDAISEPEYRAPFNMKLGFPLSRLGFPHWVTDPKFDIEYHIRHSALPSPGRYRELFILVSRLHGTLLDRSRPLWECHLIEGLPNDQFAMYVKIHHALIDGVGAMRLLQNTLSTDPTKRDMPLGWAARAERQKRERKPAPPTALTLEAASEMIQSQLGTVLGLGKALRHASNFLQLPPEERMALPFEAPRSLLNTKVTGARRFVAQSYNLDRINAVRAALDATVNDIVLAMVASALRRYLDEIGGGVPAKPLVAMVPVSIRPRDAEVFGNAVSAVLVSLGTHISDPVRRLEAIKASMADGKSLINELTFNEVMLFTMLMATPLMAPALLGLGAMLPAVNVVVSNVPGPKEPIYWNGARLSGMYPISIVFHGMALNITLASNVNHLDFGLVACRNSLPSMQRVIDFLEDALAELEEVAGIRTTVG